jgi:ABC-type amino acid transport system permease subunit
VLVVVVVVVVVVVAAVIKVLHNKKIKNPFSFLDILTGDK